MVNQNLIKHKILDSGKSVAGSGVKPTAKQRKAKFKKLLTKYTITNANKH